MRGSTGVSMGGTIEYTRTKKKKPPKKNCKKCKNFVNGYCQSKNFRPTTIELGAKCVYFTQRSFKKKVK